MKNLVCLLTLAVCSCVHAFTVSAFPKERLFHLTFADPREVKMALTVDAGAKIHAAIGNYFSFVEFSGEEWKAQMGIEGAGYFTMRQADKRFPLETTDGLIGLFSEMRVKQLELQLRYTHISAHMADGSEQPPFAYSRETASLRAGWNVNSLSYLYGGISYLTNTIPQVPRLGFQLGGSVFIPVAGNFCLPFAALDLKWQGMGRLDPTARLQLGLSLNNSPEAYESFRLYYSYATGADPRGQYYDSPLTTHAVGIEMQI